MANDATQFKDLLVAYVRQETLDPLKSLGRFLAYGVIGAVLLSLGGVLFALGIVRAVQTETGAHLQGNWSWVPYFGGLIFAAVVVVIAATRITKVPR
jgi:hypothetical protein